MFLLAIALLALCGIATYFSLSYYVGSERWVSHSQEVRSAVGDLEAALNNAARERTSYLVSGDDSDLADYQKAVSEATGQTNRLRGLTRDNPVQVANCANLESVIQTRVLAWETSIAQKKQGKLADLSTLMRQNVDIAAKSAAASEEIRAEESRLLDQRQKAAHQGFLVASTVMVASFVLALVLLFFYHRFLTAELQARENAEKQARDAYARETVLRQDEERFRLFVEAVEDYAIYTLDTEGRVISWNKGAERIKGYATQEIIGKHFSCFYPQEDQATKPPMELDVAARNGRFEDEGWRVRKDGSRFWASFVLTAIRDSSGKVIGFVKVTRDYTQKMQAQEALRRANLELSNEITAKHATEKKLASSEKSLRELSVHLLRTQDEERRRIGRDLHDSLGQYLAVLKMNLESLESTPGSNHDENTEQLAQCIRLAEDSLREVRTISYLLYPPMLEEMGLKSAIPWYLDGFTKRSSIQTTFEVDSHFGRLDRNVELALFRVLQESLTNVHRHSGSATASVHLFLMGENAVMEIEDHGKGIPSDLSEQSGEDWMGSLGVGLRGMNERIRQVGGTLEVSSTENGTVVRARVPAGEPISAMSRSA